MGFCPGEKAGWEVERSVEFKSARKVSPRTCAPIKLGERPTLDKQGVARSHVGERRSSFYRQHDYSDTKNVDTSAETWGKLLSSSLTPVP